MNTIKIGNEELPLRDADPQWITQQIVNRRKNGLEVCVLVSISGLDVDVTFATPACGGGGRGKPLRPREQELLDLWVRHRLNEVDFSPGSVVAFVREAVRLI